MICVLGSGCLFGSAPMPDIVAISSSFLARDAGFREARNVPLADLTPRYFAGRTDGLRPVTGEDILLATT